MRYVYPAILTPDKELDDWYIIRFPDLEGCTTETGGLYDALFCASRTLTEFLVNLEDAGAEIPTATHIKNVHAAENEIVTLIKANTEAHRLLNAKFATI